MKVYFGLGSNLGDRRANLNEALERLEKSFGQAPEAVSDFMETESWGFEGQSFLNAAACFDIDICPDEVEGKGLWILDTCKEIERGMGRSGEAEYDDRGERIYRDRVIDIDILMMGDCLIDNARLQVPHPLMHLRDFVMVPLRQIRKDI